MIVSCRQSCPHQSSEIKVKGRRELAWRRMATPEEFYSTVRRDAARAAQAMDCIELAAQYRRIGKPCKDVAEQVEPLEMWRSAQDRGRLLKRILLSQMRLTRKAPQDTAFILVLGIINLFLETLDVLKR